MQDLCSSLRKVLLCAMTALSLTSCEVVRSQPPAPVIQLGNRVDSIYGGVMVQGKENVWNIAQRYRLPVRDIIELNNLQPPYKLSDGQRLKLPAPMEHRVGATDTLSALSRMYNVSLSQMVKTNNLQPPYLLKTGQVLRIPSSVYHQQEVAQTIFAPPAVAPVASRTAPVMAEKLASPVMPRMSQEPVAPPQPTSTAGTQVAAVPPQLVAPYVAPKALPTPQTTVLPSTRPDFNWPLRGKVISSYGAKNGGLFNDGINIAAPKNTPVMAAADGVVAYVGNDLSSYGNLVLIRHGGGMVTAYAHLNNATVKKDMTVRKGQSIGTIGSTGTVTNTQLHFEIRQGTQTFDPIQYLRG